MAEMVNLTWETEKAGKISHEQLVLKEQINDGQEYSEQAREGRWKENIQLREKDEENA